MTRRKKIIKKVIFNYFTRSKRGFHEDTSSGSSEEENPIRILKNLEKEDNDIVELAKLVPERVIIKARRMPDPAPAPAAAPRFADLKSFINSFDGSPKRYPFFVAECERALSHAANHPEIQLLLIDYIKTQVSSLGCNFVNTHQLTNWKDIKVICDQKFTEKLSQSDILVKLTELKQDSLKVFDYYGLFADLIQKYQEILALEIPVSDPRYALAIEHINNIAMKAFEKGLNDHIRRSLVFQTPASLKEIYNLAQKFEEKEKGVVKNDENLITQKLMTLLKIAEDSANNSGFKNPQINYTTQVKCQICDDINHSAIDCPRNVQVNHTVGNNCQICGNFNHTARDCPKNPQNVVCQLCNYQGHTALQCRSAGGQQQRGMNNNRPRFSNGQGGYFGRQGNNGNFNRNGFNQQNSNRNGRGGFPFNQNNGYQGFKSNNQNSRQ